MSASVWMNQYERGKHELDYSMIERIAKVRGTYISRMITRRGLPPLSREWILPRGCTNNGVLNATFQLAKAEGKGLGGLVSIEEIGMQFGKGIQGQGKPFEAFVQKSLPEGSIDLNAIKSNFSTFDHLTQDGKAISTKTMDTIGSSAYQKPSAITSKLNGYVNDMVNFTGDGKAGIFDLTNAKIMQKEMQLAIPAGTTADQLAAIAKSIEYAESYHIKIIVTKVK